MGRFLKRLVPVVCALLLAFVTTVALCLIQESRDKASFSDNTPAYLERIREKVQSREEMCRALSVNIRDNSLEMLSLLVNTLVSADGTAPRDECILRLQDTLDQVQISEYYICSEDGTVLFAPTGSSSCRFVSELGLNLPEQADAVSSSMDQSVYFCVPFSDAEDEKLCLVVPAAFADADFIYGFLSNYGDIVSLVGRVDTMGLVTVNKESGVIGACSKQFPDLQGLSAQEAGLGSNEELLSLCDGEIHRVILNGQTRTLRGTLIQSDLTADSCVFAVFTPIRQGYIVQILMILLGSCVLYVFMGSMGKSGSGCGRKKMLKRMFFSAGGVVLAACIFIALVINLSGISTMISKSRAITQTISNCLEQVQNTAEEMKGSFTSKRVVLLSAAGYYCESVQGRILNENDGINTHRLYEKGNNGSRVYLKDSLGNARHGTAYQSVLVDLADKCNLTLVTLYGEDGRVLASSGGNWADSLYDGTSDGNWLEVLERTSPYYYEVTAEEKQIRECFVYPVKLFMSGKDGETVYADTSSRTPDMAGEDGIVVITSVLPPELLTMNGLGNSWLKQISALTETSNTILTATEDRSMEVVISDGSVNEAMLANFGLQTASSSRHDYFLTSWHGNQCYAFVNQYEGSEFLLTIFDAFKTDAILTLLPAYCGIILLACLGIALYYVKREPEKETSGKQTSYKSISKRVDDALADRKSSSGEDTLSDKSKFIDVLLTGLLLLIIFVGRYIEPGVYEDNAPWYIVSMQWRNNVNIFSVCYTVLLIAAFMVFNYLLRKLILWMVPIFSPHLKTIAGVILSLLRCVGCVFILFFILNLFGADTATLITSAGVLSMAVGIGLNGTVNDMVSVVQLIYHHTLQLDDVVTVNGFTGKITSIGLRSTRITDESGNVKTFSNSRLDGIVNHSFNYAAASIKADVSTSFTPKDLKALVEGEMDEIFRSYETGYGKPYVDGIAVTGENSYSASICLHCDRENIQSMQNLLYICMNTSIKQKDLSAFIRLSAPAKGPGVPG